MPLVVVVLLLAFFSLLMRMSYKCAMRRWEVECAKAGVPVRQRKPVAPTYPLVGPPEYPHGVINTAVGKFGESCLEVDVRSWFYVRELEQEALGAIYHRADGTTNACGWEPIDEAESLGQNAPKAGLSSEAKRRAEIIAEGMVDEDPGVGIHTCVRCGATWEGLHGFYYCRNCVSDQIHRCRNCSSTDTWQSSIDGHWRCHKADCQPCYCGHCDGRMRQHNDDARALYKAQTELALSKCDNRKIDLRDLEGR